MDRPDRSRKFESIMRTGARTYATGRGNRQQSCKPRLCRVDWRRPIWQDKHSSERLRVTQPGSARLERRNAQGLIRVFLQGGADDQVTQIYGLVATSGVWAGSLVLKPIWCLYGKVIVLSNNRARPADQHSRVGLCRIFFITNEPHDLFLRSSSRTNTSSRHAMC